MARPLSRTLLLAAYALLSASLTLMGAHLASADEPARGTVRLEGTADLLAHGDGKLRLTIDFQHADYAAVKRANPNPHRFLRDFASGRADFEIGEGAVATYDDAQTAVRLELTERGAIKNAGNGSWSLAIERGAEFVTRSTDPDGRVQLHFYETGTWDGGITYKGQVRYRAPTGATEVRYDKASREIRYQLEAVSDGSRARLAALVSAKPRLMSALYKVYGLGTDFNALWVAKSVFKNEGTSTIRNLRVRYKLDGYADWSLWERHAEVVPEQTIVSPYYPVLDAKIARLTSNTPANVRVEWTYEDDAGKKHESSDGRRIVILGRHEFVFSNLTAGDSYGTWHEQNNNAPFLAAWVSRDDLVVKQFAAMANKIAGGVGAGTDAKSTIKVLEAIYVLLQRNDVSYQHPPALKDRSISFDPQVIQNIKFPRDVIRDRSGTCVDLAILYAALANAVGIEAKLAIVPGHCYPVFRLAGTDTDVAVESTKVGGGLRAGSAPFADAFETGLKELQRDRRDGRIYLIDLNELWTRGVSNPELPELPADILQKWDLRVDAPAAPNNGPVGPQQAPDRKDAHSVGPQQRGIEGTWQGHVATELEDGTPVRYPVAFELKRKQDGSHTAVGIAQLTVHTPRGPVTVRIIETFVGTVRGGRLLLRGTSKVATNLATKQSERLPLDEGVITLSGNGLAVRLGNASEGYVTFRLTR